MVRHGFRTREEGSLVTRQCGKCGGTLYVVKWHAKSILCFFRRHNKCDGIMGCKCACHD